MSEPQDDRRPFVFDIHTAIATWRQFLSKNPALSREDLEELEDHLSEEIEALKSTEMSDEKRFRTALARVGDMAKLDADYDAVLWEKRLAPSRAPREAMAALGLFGSYLKTAWAGIVRHRGYALLNLTGLAVALAACIVIVLYVGYELSFDRFHSNADRIYRLEMKVPTDQRWPSAYLPVGPELESSIPEIEHVARMEDLSNPLIQVGRTRFSEEHFYFAEPELLDIFDFEILEGSPTSLQAPYTILLSASAAAKYFPDEEAVGKSLLVGRSSSSPSEEYEVVGVYADMPMNSHFRADFIGSYATVLSNVNPDTKWYRLSTTYLSLAPGASLTAVGKKIDTFWKEFVPVQGDADKTVPVLQPLTRIHLFGELTTSDLEPQGDIAYVIIFVCAAILLLIVACVNYINLSVARYATRSREVGVRKVVGANRPQLILQFLGESFLYVLLACIAAIGLVLLSRPALATVLDLDFQVNEAFTSLMLLAIPSILVIALISGSYPAFYLSRFSPNAVLKGASTTNRRALLRKGILLFQFMVTSGLIVATAVVHEQLMFAQDKKFGFENEQLLLLPTGESLDENAGAFRDALLRIPGAQSVSFAYSFPGQPTALRFYGEDEIEDYEGDTFPFEIIWVDTAYVQTVGLHLAAGRSFSAERTEDLENTAILNETAVRALGWDDPIGKYIGQGDWRREVIGVVQDFHMTSMYEDIEPLILMGGRYTRNTGVSVSTRNLRQLMADVRDTWTNFIPSRPFEYSFLDDDFKAMYRKETQLGRLFTAFSLLTILVALLGLFGLASFDAQQRTKEIGIRKSVGASASSITLLLSRQFFVLVAVSFVASTPIIYYVMSKWLERFAYRIDLSAGLFILSGLLILLVAALTVGVQAARAAVTSPVKCLRQE